MTGQKMTSGEATTKALAASTAVTRRRRCLRRRGKRALREGFLEQEKARREIFWGRMAWEGMICTWLIVDAPEEHSADCFSDVGTLIR